MTLWIAVLVTSLGSYLLKLAGLSVPERLLDSPRMQRIAALLPVALLAALTAVQVWASGQTLALDARVAAFGFAVVALILRAPFLVVVIGSAAMAAAVRALG